jgi:transcriptional regulator with XRE-family HTH domain
MDLGLYQREVAVKIGVSEASIHNWERGIEPELIHIPKILDFLGYVPFKCPEDPIGRLKHFKLIHGLSYQRLGKVMGRDPEQLTDWLSNGIRPCKRNLIFISQFLDNRLELSY